MKKRELQRLNEELFNSDEILSNELRELVEVIGGAASPGTSKDKDCSQAKDDCTYNNNDTTKYRSDSTESGDTIRADDHCNDEAAQTVLQAIEKYNKESNDVVSGDLMGYEGPCSKEI